MTDGLKTTLLAFPLALGVAGVAILGATIPAGATACPSAKTALGVSRVVEIDASNGAMYGEFTKQKRAPDFLKPKEVVLTFDDGPIPRITKPILDALDKYCTKATFFVVGKMALAYPSMVREIAERGHTIAGHTWTHPLNLRRLSLKRAKDQIERGFSSTSLAAGGPIAPFFRFPGLSDSGPLLKYLEGRDIASFSVDIVSNDSYIGSSSRLISRVMRLTKRRKGGILLFHDIKRVTARSLPRILGRLKAEGYKVVHLRPTKPVVLDKRFDKANAKRIKGAVPKYKTWKPGKAAPALQTAAGDPPPVTAIPEGSAGAGSTPTSTSTSDEPTFGTDPFGVRN